MVEQPDPGQGLPPDWPPALIPTDDDVEAGQRPFTDFGQFGYGHLDRRVFDQDVYWVNIAGVPFFLVDMSPEYRRNVIGVPAQLRRAVVDRRALLGLPRGSLPSRDARSRTTRSAPSSTMAPTCEELGPQGWIEATPLMQRLRKLTPDADGP